MPLTDAEKQAYARANIDTVDCWAIELRHSTFSSPVRLINYQVDITHTLEADAPVDASTAVLFTALAFTFIPPKLGDDPVSLLRAQLDGVPGIIQPYIATATQTSEPIEATFRELLIDVTGPTVLQNPYILHLRVHQVVSTMETVVLEAGRINSANQPFPNKFYTPASNPGLDR